MIADANIVFVVVLNDFSPMRTIRPGEDIAAQQTGPLLDSLNARVAAMPPKLQ